MEQLRSQSEIQIQADIWRDIWEIEAARRCLFHVPNESTYNNSQQGSSGVIPGVQDLIFVWAGRTWYIELKDDRGVISTAQKLIHSLWKVQGYDTFVFYEAESAKQFIRSIIAGADDFIIKEVYGSFVSPYSVAEKYPEYLQKYKDEKKNRRERASKKSFTKK